VHSPKAIGSGELTMVVVSWFISWIILVCIGIIAVYSTGQAIERWWPTMALFYFVLLSTGVLVGSYVTAVRLVGVEQAACEELEPSADRLLGSTPSEFRQRCIATQNVFESINWRRL
jgi:hypothetical protein